MLSRWGLLRVFKPDPLLRIIFSDDSGYLFSHCSRSIHDHQSTDRFAVEQTIEGRLISPLVLGNQLAIHPVTILLVLLTSGKLFGIIGVILGIPVYAAAKVVITHVFEWYTTISSLYEENPLKKQKE